jgi:hypothetical protein
VCAPTSRSRHALFRLLRRKMMCVAPIRATRLDIAYALTHQQRGVAVASLELHDGVRVNVEVGALFPPHRWR